VVVKVIPPNAFTPNGDGINDVWQIDDLKSFPKCKVSVFNRNGSIMFYSIGYNKPWSGDRNNVPCPPGIYYYTINLDEKQVISGSISLMK
jgi:gliding motility-associated-like protein